MRASIKVADAPGAIGPYSQAMVARLHGGNRMVFTSGQVALDPKTGELEGSAVGEQTERVFRNLAAVLAGAGLTLEDVVKTTVFLVDMNDFAAMNKVYEKHFTSDPPARTTVAAAALPRGARVEIDAIAIGRDF
jgi:2-iminobutanoate/2-iminopropanoate deaminase